MRAAQAPERDRALRPRSSLLYTPRRSGSPVMRSQSRKELEQATRLRKEHDQIIQLRYAVLKNPRDLDTRFQVAKWMMEHGHEDEGLKWTKEILRADPRHAQTHRVLADYYAKHGEPGWLTIIV